MDKNTKLIIGLGIVALVAIFVLIAFARNLWQDAVDETLAKYEQNPTTDTGSFGEAGGDPYVTKGILVPPVRQGDPMRGPSRPQLTIIEFGDFQCPYCSDLTGVLDQVLIKYPTIRLVWKDLPNPLHPEARSAALAARCAQSQDKFWQYHDYLFANQDLLAADFYQQIARELELDLPSFNSCLDSGAFIEVVGQGLDDANNYDVDGTPYLFVGNQRINQAVSFDELEQVILSEFNRLNAAAEN
jgi:protein-disulfide isomerase